jgi:hypothetical protein
MLNYSKRVLLTTLALFFVGNLLPMPKKVFELIKSVKGVDPIKSTKELDPIKYKVEDISEWVKAAPDVVRTLKTKKTLETAKDQLEQQKKVLTQAKMPSEERLTAIYDRFRQIPEAKLRTLFPGADNPKEMIEKLLELQAKGSVLIGDDKKNLEKLINSFTDAEDIKKDIEEIVRRLPVELQQRNLKTLELNKQIENQLELVNKQLEEYKTKLGKAKAKGEEIIESAKKHTKGALWGAALLSFVGICAGGKLDEALGLLFGLVFGDEIGKLVQEATHNFFSPNANPKAPEDDEEYHGTLQKVADLFTDIDKDFKNALTKCRYTDKKFKIYVGKVDAIEVFIEYDFEQDGAGDVGLPFTPFFVTLSPQQINGYAVTPDDLLGKMADGDAKDLTSYLLDPPASLIFMIKYIQLTNSALKSSAKDYSETMDYITDETIELFSRLNLSMEDVSPAVILKNMPEPILDELSKKIRVYSYYVKKLDEPVEEQRTALVEKILEFGTIKDFDTKLEFINQQIIPEVNKKLYLDDRDLFVYLIEFVADILPDDLVDSPDKIEKIKERCDKLLPIIERSKNAMETTEFDPDQIQKMTTLFGKISSVKEDPTKFNLKKPDFGDFKQEYQENSLDKALEVFYNVYQRINHKKIDVDNYYFDISILNYSRRYTKYNLQVIFYNCLRYLNKAEAEITQKDGELSLLNFDGKAYTADAKSDLESMLKKPAESIKTARETVQTAIKTISTVIEAIKGAKKIVEDKDYKKAQEEFVKAVNQAKEVVKSVSNARMRFRRAYAPYFPISMPDGSSKTTAQVLKSNIEILKKHSTYVDKLIPGVYTPFSKHLGLTEKQLLSIIPPQKPDIDGSPILGEAIPATL